MYRKKTGALTGCLAMFLLLISCIRENRDGNISGQQVTWHTTTIDFRGPLAAESDNDPNPFTDYRLQVLFTGPDGQVYDVPGFFAGDGEGGGTGNIWRVRFTPDQSGAWRYSASFQSGRDIAVNLDKQGKAVSFDGARGRFQVKELDTTAPGFLKWGRLEYNGGHYLKFRDGGHWIKGGTDSPENFLAYEGFDNTRESLQNYDGLESLPGIHVYDVHVEDWQPGDPVWGEEQGKGIIGALNYLASRHVNSIYFLVMNIGGDGKDVFPWIGSPDPGGSTDNDNLHYDVSKLRQWEIVFDHAQKKGLFLHMVLNEAEEANKRELDNGELGPERKLYYRELIARFGHHLAMQWNLSEEYNLKFNFGPERIRDFATYINKLDPYDHPVTVHSAGDPLKELAFTFGDTLFNMTSVQLNQRRIDRITERLREATAQAGHRVPASLDEFTVDAGSNRSWIPVDDAGLHRKEKLWPAYLSGGNIEFILEGFLEVDNFKTPEREKLWNYTWYARKFMQEHLPFWEMEPVDELVHGEATIPVGEGDGKTSPMGAQVFGKAGEVYAVYYPSAKSTGTIDLSDAGGSFELRWYNPRTGEFSGPVSRIDGGKTRTIGTPPSEPDEDWTLLLTKTSTEKSQNN